MTAPAPEALIDVTDVTRRMDALLQADRILSAVGEDVGREAMQSRLAQLAHRYEHLSRPPGIRPASCPAGRPS
jgi:hypothetical protein